MNHLRSILLVAVIGGVIGAVTGTACFAKGPDNTLYASLLKKYVQDEVVNYQGFKQEEGKLDLYLDSLDRTEPSVLRSLDQLAFYINAYNAYTIKLILDNFRKGQPPQSIKKTGGLFSGPWSLRFCRIGGKTYTLNNIEHDIIRPIFKDPRVHFAINCASKSCPPLIDEPYEGASLNRQLTENTVAFLHDTTHNYYKNNTLYASQIFEWFKEDFDGTVAFFLRYTKGTFKQELELRGNALTVKHLKYDWSLNSSR